MNSLKPALKLCFPTEMQWEYACRVDNATPFLWGEQMDSALVNFDGNVLYNNERNSEYREQTVEVKQFSCNDMGHLPDAVM